ncbi:BamA/TamA family outer membrane protein [Sphingomonas cavernae]|uniref:Bacterial surface antigen (D15) domain-containing protein n=1 Tax=Sphingomonas cavernae TaxID=2320861 RepID=A0A418W725_9SPHN|nr:BamA/TamA family outer membrane protein [Sphingomonas cavernae]RJF85654.1 hypothetical protein D3876_17280 [Sphingomonas cavernae]
MELSIRLSSQKGLATVALAMIAVPASAQQGPIDETIRPRPGDAAIDPASVEPRSVEKTKKKRDLLIAPVPFSSPTTGTGLAVGGVAFYNPNNGPHQWVTGGGLIWSSGGSKGFGAFHTMSFDKDRFRVNATFSYFDARSKFYGIGAEDGDRGEALELASEKFSFQVRAQMRAFPHGFVGLRYKLTATDAAPRDTGATPPPSTSPPPADQLHSTLSMLGPMIAYDTRDSHTQPHSGVYGVATWLFGTKALGDSYEHNKLTLVGSAYLPFGSDTVFAVNGTLCSTGGEAPYYDLCLFGSSGVLRGYPSGRYRDGASWAVQGELRHQFAKRWGGVAFFGVGGIAPSVGDFLDDGNVLPAAGVGVRYRPFKNNDVHLRLDVAIGKNDHGVYLGIGEAF